MVNLNLTDRDIGVRNPVLNSIAETAKANKLKPYNYFEYLLTEIQKHMDDHDICFCEDLLPWSDKRAQEWRSSDIVNNCTSTGRDYVPDPGKKV